jgi:hypothetical protein
LGCGVCGEDPVPKRKLWSMSGSQQEDVRICILQSGAINVHFSDDGDD